MQDSVDILHLTRSFLAGTTGTSNDGMHYHLVIVNIGSVVFVTVLYIGCVGDVFYLSCEATVYCVCLMIFGYA